MHYKLFVGIDQSKLTLDACVLREGELHHEKFDNNEKGFKKMLRWIKSLYHIELHEILFCSEHTGIYSLPLSIFLTEEKANLWLENPLQIKLSSGLKRGKSDSADAKDIARYCYTHRDKARLYQLPGKNILALRQLLAFRERLVKQQTILKITGNELKEFDADASGLIIKESKSLIRTYDKKIELIEEQMLEIIKEDETLSTQMELVQSVHGVGKQTALHLISITQGFTLFDGDWRKFACYCGIAPFEYTSGTSLRGRTRVSHLANKKLKSLLTMCALNTIKKENEFKIYYDRRTAEGKSPMSTINILRNKIVSRIFAAVKRGTPYQSIIQQAT